MRTRILFVLAFLYLVTMESFAQTNNTPMQTIRGTVRDQDTQAPLIGATIAVISTQPMAGTSTDIDGSFRLERIPVGRHTISVNYLGYEPLQLSGIVLTSGKELVLELNMTESTIALEEVVIKADIDKREALNEFAVVSARSFSVEETSRYAGSFFDPARMAQNFAGVSVGSGDDLTNEIVVRGNSPRGILWRLEGIEIPNPNHFGAAGSTGGGISMLSSTTLANSDFYSGAFPAEFGNATSGVFDLNLRNGNNEKREYAMMVGLLGLEFGTEGPISKNGKGSYLFNYRYSTLSALEALGLSPVDDVLPKYQDLSFKINLPTENFGTFALFGLGGTNSASFDPEPDTRLWESDGDKWGFEEEQYTGVIGLSHKLLLNDKSYLKTVLSASIAESRGNYFYLDSLQNFGEHMDSRDMVRDESYRISSTYNRKFNARNTIRAGAILSALKFRFTFDEDNGENLQRFFDNTGNTQFLQAFVQWKHRWNDKWTALAGLHYSHFMLNGNYAIEPRASLQYKISDRSSLSASLGIHSKLEHLAIYLFDGSFADGDVHLPGRDLELSKAMHAVIGFDQRLGSNSRIKLEAYYQDLYDIPIESDPNSTRSLINAADIWDVIGTEDAISAGRGRNIGIDLTIEKFFDQSFYFLITGSLFDSKFRTQTEEWYNTRYNSGYQLSILGGKEYRVGKKNLLGFNGRLLFSGGNRTTPLNEAESIRLDEAVFFEDRPYTELPGAYQRIDFGFSYKINTRKMTHSIMLDIQNVFNRQNLFGSYYNSDNNQIEDYYQTGLFPVLNYRIEF